MKKTAVMIVALMMMSSAAYAQFQPLSYNTDVDDLGNGQKRYHIHTAHINYKDPSDQKLKKIDTRLTFNEVSRVYKQTKASFYSEIPEYADGEFSFQNLFEGADHYIKARPVANHVKGVLTNGAEDGNFVLYKDAFGSGIDLKVYAYHHGLKKVIIFREKPAVAKDYTFDFQITNVAELRAQLTDQQVIDLKNAYDFKAKTVKIGGADSKFSYMRDARLWDSGQKNQSVDIAFVKSGSKIYIRKTVKWDFLNATDTVYPVLTDHPTSYATIGVDGWIEIQDWSSASSWDIVHDASSGTVTDNQDWLLIESFRGNGYWRRIKRTFITIDTSGIDDGASISAAILKVSKVYDITNNDNDGEDFAVVVESTQASATSLTGEDYDQCGAINSPTEGSNRIDFGDINVGYNDFILNSDGRGWISKTSYTKLGLREGHDVLDHDLGGEWYSNSWAPASSEYTGTNHDPYLDVTTGGGATETFSSRGVGRGIARGIGR